MTLSTFRSSARWSLLALCGAGLVACGQNEQAPAAAPTEPVAVEPATPDATSPAVATSTDDWTSLQTQVGQMPSVINLFDSSPISDELRVLLGAQFDAFKANMQVEAPLQEDKGILFTSGNKQHEGGSEQAYLLINPKTHGLEVGLWQKGKLTVHKTQGNAIAKPADIQTMISNAAN